MHRIHGVWALSDGWTHLALVALVIATAAQTAFVGIYATRPWYLVRTGRALMLKSATLCLLLWLSLFGTFFVYPNEKILLAGHFSDYTGKFVIHCHMLDHEDHGLMSQFQVVRD